MDDILTPSRPDRPGIPIDPVLQLYAGEARRLATVTIGASLSARLCIEDPMRVALYVLPGQVAASFALNPFASTMASTVAPSFDGLPLSIHCRDYPGLTQCEWYVTGSMGDTFAVWEYRLLPQWV